MFSHKEIYYVGVGRYEFWVSSQEQLLFAEEFSDAVKWTEIIDKYSTWSCSQIILFLEFPWILLDYKTVIPLSFVEAIQYSRNIFSFSNTEQFSKVGFCFFDLPENKKKGVLCAALPNQTIKLISALKKKAHVKVEPIPLFYGCLPTLINKDVKSVTFYGMNSMVYMEMESDSLQQITFFSESIKKEANELILKDYLQKKIEDSQRIYFTTPISRKGVDQNSLSVFDFLPFWKEGIKSTNNNFKWETQTLSLKINWKIVAASLGCLLILWMSIWVIITEKTIDKHQRHLSQIKHTLEVEREKVKNFEGTIEKHEQFIQVNTIYQHLSQSELIPTVMMKQLVNRLNKSIWVEKLVYENKHLKLTLLTLKASEIPVVLDQLSNSPIIHKLLLKSQQKIQLSANQEVIQFVVQMDLRVRQ